MANSLKDALLKAGLRSAKVENERKSKQGREIKQSEKHQELRNYCEHCNCTQPDVEKFRHRSPFTDAQWICSACADKLEIHDNCRTTQQSEFAKNGRYRREYGPTLDLSKTQVVKKDDRRPQGNRGPNNGRNDGNRGGNHR